MKKILCASVFLISSLFCDDYDFDMDAIEQKSYEYGGYIKTEDKFQRLNHSRNHQNFLHLEALLDFSYDYDILKLNSSLASNYDYVKNKTAHGKTFFNELYIDAKPNNNHTFLFGKKSLKWGKGYFLNPVSFFDRPKDPSDPTIAREGFIVAKYNYNKSLDGELKNISLDAVYLPSTSDINKDYYTLLTNSKDANNAALKLYMLLYDTDIDIIYSYSDETNEKIGIDFSKNLQTNFEIHGEYAKTLNKSFSYLLGIRYLTEYELTLISEYLYNSKPTYPFTGKDYLLTLLTQKDPLDILYLNLYYKNMTNLQDDSMQNKVGFSYAFKNNLEIDISYNINNGTDSSEFGTKQIRDFFWLKLTWNF